MSRLGSRLALGANGEEDPVEDETFDRVARSVDRLTSRRTTLGSLAGAGLGAFLSGIGAATEARKNRKKNKKRKCKKPKITCGKTCCSPGQGCVRGKCVSCPAGSVFCEGVPGVVERGCTEGACCFDPCSGETCCPANQECVAAPTTTFCRCAGEDCGGSCCPPGQVCAANVCGACPAGADPLCNQSPALACGCGFCATSVNNTTACVNETVFQCADCTSDSECTTLLGRPGLCVAVACTCGETGNKICLGICP